MQPSQSRNPENKKSGVLKTTTWGTLIALSLLIAGLGLTGHLSPTGGTPQVVQTAANIPPDSSAGIPSVGHSSHEFSTGRGASNGRSPLAPLSGVLDNSGLTPQKAAPAGSNSLSSKSSSATIKDQAPAPQDPGAV